MTRGPGPDSRLADLIRDVPDHPKPGVVFKDITPLLADAAAFAEAVTALAGAHSTADVDLVAGIEARGFILAAPVAAALGTGFVPIRKQGKLPGQTRAVGYDLEYGTAEIEIHDDAVPRGSRVLLIDDVLATGGTAAAACALIEASGGTVVEVAMLLELGFLAGRERLAGRLVRSVLSF
jgi:adenine phosphoribosyltransferase